MCAIVRSPSQCFNLKSGSIRRLKNPDIFCGGALAEPELVHSAATKNIIWFLGAIKVFSKKELTRFFVENPDEVGVLYKKSGLSLLEIA
jgi:hypothetical protein